MREKRTRKSAKGRKEKVNEYVIGTYGNIRVNHHIFDDVPFPETFTDGRAWDFITRATDLTVHRLVTVGETRKEAFKLAVAKETREMLGDYITYKSVPIECDYRGNVTEYTGFKKQQKSDESPKYYYITYFTVRTVPPFVLPTSELDQPIIV
jgi:hypothetical protein